MSVDLKRGLRATEVSATPATPAAGKRLLYPKSDGWYEKTSAGVETKIGPSAGGTASPITTLAVRVATWSNTTLSGTQSVDGVTVAVGDRVLVRNQTVGADNGIYVVSATAWTRATDSDTWAKLVGTQVYVTEGTQYGRTVLTSTVPAVGTLGTTSVGYRVTRVEMVGSLNYPGPQGGGHLLYDYSKKALTVWDDSQVTWQSMVSSASTELLRHAPVTVATTVNITLSGLQTIDGYALVAGQRVLVKDQTNVATNGIYIAAAGAWTTAADSTTQGLLRYDTIFVQQGTANINKVFTLLTVPASGTVTFAEGVYDGPNRVYSDSNPPDTLQMTEFPVASVPTPPSGQSTVHTTDGSALLMRDDAGVDRVVGQIVPEQTVTVDYTSTMPALPAAGLTSFSRFRARRLPAFVGPTGQDSRLQPFMGSNRIARWNAVAANVAGTTDGVAVTALNNATAALTAVTPAATGFFAAMVRARVASTATAGTAGGLRSATPQWFVSGTANLGGFHFVARFGLSSYASGVRGFVGLSSQNAAYAAGTNPSAQLTQVGLVLDTASANWRVMSAGTAVGTITDLGTNFAGSTGTYFYEFSLYSPSGAGQVIYWSITRLNDGIYAGGVFGSAGSTALTTLPAVNTLMNFHANYGNGALAAAHSMDIQSVYLETDN